MKVLVINQCAHNKGDRAVLYFVLRELARNDASQVWVSTTGPGLEAISDYRVPTQVEFIPVSWSFPAGRDGNRLVRKASHLLSNRRIESRFRTAGKLAAKNRPVPVASLHVDAAFSKALLECDFVLSTGGHHLTSLLRSNVRTEQLYDMCVSLLAGKPLVLWSQSFGPCRFSEALYEDLVRWVLSGAAAIYVRDEHSTEELSHLGVDTSTVRKTYESVIGLNDIVADYIPPSQRDNVVGVSVYHAQQRSQSAHKAYVGAMSQLVDHIVQIGHTPLFFPMEPKKEHDDRGLIREILTHARFGREDFLCDQDLGPRAHIERVSRCKLFVGHKTHSVIFALTTGTPLVAIAYHTKTEDFMNDYRLPEYCVREDVMSRDILASTLSRALADCDTLGPKIFERSRVISGRVRHDFAAMMDRMGQRRPQ